MQLNAPTLVIVSGAPGSGKTTLARRLARHAAHFDADRAADLADDLLMGRYSPLDLAIPTLVVDTTDGWHPAYEEIREFAALPRASLRT